jgi:hypothetical protein
MKAEIGLTLFNGALEGLLCLYNIHEARPVEEKWEKPV